MSSKKQGEQVAEKAVLAAILGNLRDTASNMLSLTHRLEALAHASPQKELLISIQDEFQSALSWIQELLQSGFRAGASSGADVLSECERSLKIIGARRFCAVRYEGVFPRLKVQPAHLLCLCMSTLRTLLMQAGDQRQNQQFQISVHGKLGNEGYCVQISIRDHRQDLSAEKLFWPLSLIEEQ